MDNDHTKLFEAYVMEMRDSMSLALEWWEEVLSDEKKRIGGGADEAILRVKRRWPFGPAGHPYVIATYRKFYLACEQINEEQAKLQSPDHSDVQPNETEWGVEGQPYSEDGSPISGWVLLIDSLRGKHNDIAMFLNGFVFNPIATDRRTGRLT